MGSVHIDVELNLDQVGPRLRRALRAQAQQAGNDFERQFGVSGRRAGERFSTEFGRASGRRGGVWSGRAVWRDTTVAAGVAGREAGDAFSGSFTRGIRTGLGGRRVRRPLSEVVGASLGTAVRGMTLFTVAAGGAVTAVSLLTGAIGPLVTVVGGLGAGLAQASGALALLPAVGAAAAASIAALVVGFQGFGDAIKAINDGDPKKINEALKELSPNARKAAEAFQNLKPALGDLRRSVQDALFDGMGEQLGQLDKTLLPTLERGLSRVATGLNTQMREVFKEVTSADFTRDLDTMFKNTARGAKNAAPGMRAMASALNQIATVGSSFLPRLGKSFSKLAKDFENYIARVRDSGALADFIDDGIDKFKQLGRILRDFGAGILDVFNIADAAGGGMFSNLEKMAAGFRSFTESASGQAQLTQLFASIQRAGEAMAPVFRQLFDTIVQLSPVFADIAEKVGPKLSLIIEKIGDALEEVGPEIGDAFAGIGEALSEILPAVLKLAGPFSTLLNAVLQPLVPVVEKLAPALGWVARQLANLVNKASDVGAGPLLGIAGALLLLRRRLKGLPGRLRGATTALSGFLGAASGKGRGGKGGSGAAAGLGAAAGATGKLAKNSNKLKKGKVALWGAFLASLFIPDDVGNNIAKISDDVVKLSKGAEILTGGDRSFDLSDTFNAPETFFTAAADGFRGLAAAISGNEVALKNLREEWTTTVKGQAMADPMEFIGNQVQDVALRVADSAEFVKRMFGLEFPEAVWNGVGLIGEAISGGLVPTVETGVGEAIAAATGFAPAFGTQILGGIGLVSEGVPGAMEGLGGSIAAGVGLAAGRASVFGPALGAQIQLGIGIGQAAATAGMDSIGAAIAAGAYAAGSEGRAMGPPLGQSMRSALGIANAEVTKGMATLGRSIRDGTGAAARQASGLGSQIRSAIGSIDLYGVGSSMMRGLGLGISAGGQAAVHQARSIAASIRGLFPASPAKWGPFAGDGHPERLGRKLMTYLASGISGGRSVVESAALRGAHAAARVGSAQPVGFGAFGGFGGGPAVGNTYRTINAPITVTAPAADPSAVAAQVVNRLDSIAAQIAI